MNKNLLYVFLLTGLLGSAQDLPTAFSLSEAVEWGMNYNRTLKRATIEVQKAHKEKWKTLSIGFPQIQANLAYQNNIEQPVSLIPAQFFGGEEGEFAEVVFGTQQTAMGMVELNQLIFDGTYVVGVQGIRHFIETAENVLEKTQIEVKKAIITSYVNALVARESLAVLEKNAIALGKNIEEAHQLFKNGFAEEETVEQLRLTLSSLNSQIRYARKSADLADNVFKLLLGIEITEQPQLSNSLEELTALYLLEEKPASNYDNNIDIRLAENEVTTNGFLYRLERAKALPSFSAFLNGSYMGNNEEFAFTESTQKWFGAAAFGFRMRIPVFSSLGRSASAQKAKLSVLQSETKLIEVKAQVFVEWQNALNSFALAKEEHATALENLSLAQRIEQKNTTKFFEGLSGSFDLRQAQLQLYRAQQNTIQCMRQVILDKTNLDTIINNVQ
ncbi:MAG: TolC family protein [Flavobacteriaceae bacterium]|nr:TolC family protein [Flavobacteriaceae bacterium]